MSFKHFIALGAITALTACGGSGSKTDVTNTVEFGDGSSTSVSYTHLTLPTKA